VKEKNKILDRTLSEATMIGRRILLEEPPLNVGVPWYLMELMKVSAENMEVGG